MCKNISKSDYQLGVISESEDQKRIIPSHEKLWVWQKAHNPMLVVHSISQSFPADERYRLKDQIRRSSKSVPDNISEGVNAYYYNEKIKAFRHSRKEAGETQNHVREMQRKKYYPNKESEALIYKCEEIIRGLNGLIRYFSNKRDNSQSKGHYKN